MKSEIPLKFGEYSKFNENMSLLVAGLRKLFISPDESSKFGDADSADSHDQGVDGKNAKESRIHCLFIY